MYGFNKKTERLLKQYPFLPKIIFSSRPTMFPLGITGHMVGLLSIRFERADADLMYRRARNIGLGNDTGFLGFTSGKRKGQVAKQGEYLFTVGDDGSILRTLTWPGRHDRIPGESQRYAYWGLWAGKTAEGMLNDPLHGHTAYLVWVTVTVYHEATGDLERPFGPFIERELAVTVYREPREGFWQLQERANAYDNLELDSDTLARGMFEKDPDLMRIDGHLGELCRLFQDEVYDQGVRDILQKSAVRGARGMLGSIEMLAAELCGYHRIMLEAGGTWISFQSRDQEGLYVLGMRGTLPRIRNLVRTAATMWRDPRVSKAFVPDEKVSVM